MLCCPECGSKLLYRDGLRYTNQGPIQRWLCRNCGFRFSESTQGKVKLNVFRKLSEMSKPKHDLRNLKPRNVFPSEQAFNNPSFTISENVASHGSASIIPTVGKTINTFYPNSRNCRVCVSEGEAKNLAEVETQAEAKRESTEKAEIKGKIVEFLWYMKKQGYSEETIKTYVSAIHKLAEANLNLMDSEAVKEFLAKENLNNAYKYIIIAAYTLFLKTQGLKWDPPLCNVTRSLPFIPTERELDDLIAAVGKKTATFLQLLKETAMRVGEASKLKWINVDLQRKTITLNNPEKNGNPRIFNISSKLVDMLASLPKTSEYIFGTKHKTARGSVFYRLRKKIAYKLANPRLLEIGFHTFRHWKATMLYHETHDPVLVKEFLGHKTLETTLLYIQLEKALFKEESNGFIVKATKDSEEIQGLLEVGFEYVCQKDGLVFFRKRK